LVDYCLNLPPPFILLSPAIGELVDNEKSIKMIKLNNIIKIKSNYEIQIHFSKALKLVEPAYPAIQLGMFQKCRTSILKLT